MIVYVEAVLFDNFCLDFLLARLTLSVNKRKARSVRVALSALVGSGLALLYPLISEYALLMKIVTLFVCSAIFGGERPIVGYFRNLLVYLILSFVLCGAISFLLDSNPTGFIGGNFGGAVGLTALGVLLLLYTVRQVRGLVKEARRREKLTVAEMINKGKRVRIDALYDSGNLLTDHNGRGVVVTDRRKAKELGELSSLGEIRVKTVGGDKVLALVKIPEIKIYSDNGENILTNVTAALSDLPDEYALILPCE